MRIAIWIVVAIPTILIVVVALNAPGDIIKDYRFPRVEIDATVRPDGALVLDESRTYEFATSRSRTSPSTGRCP
jgi:hypothetical protein